MLRCLSASVTIRHCHREFLLLSFDSAFGYNQSRTTTTSLSFRRCCLCVPQADNHRTITHVLITALSSAAVCLALQLLLCSQGEYQLIIKMESFHDPPFRSFYNNLFNKYIINNGSSAPDQCIQIHTPKDDHDHTDQQYELPLIDLNRLNQHEYEEDCKREIVEAAQEWGFFQVYNHGVSSEILEKMKCEQMKVFRKPFEEKVNGIREFDFLAGSYRWGTPSATCLRQLAWSEAFHVPLTEISTMDDVNSFSATLKQYVKMVSKVAEKVAGILGEKVGQKAGFFKEKCAVSMCYIRMNRYPSCPNSPDVFGLMPHTDSDFLTVLHQDNIGGLELLRNGKWIAVNPRQDTLIVIVGDLFQAWSNDVYKSVEHRVVANKQFERFSTAYFMCPSNETVIESCSGDGTSNYRRFSFGEFRRQVEDDVKKFGHKVGLRRFIL